ncbi:MAG TPA: potassium transporter TrkH, partial [Patescibacteria group bacterium]|nr:potassium transporter TrkH [Patescibacteria group bacterium]
MFDLRPVFFVTGVLLSLLAVAMCVPAAVDAVHDNADWLVFLASAAVTLFFGLSLIAANWVRRATFSVRQIFLLTALGWIG